MWFSLVLGRLLTLYSSCCWHFFSILIYVDDLLITGNSLSSITKFKRYLSSFFHINDFRHFKVFLGLEVTYNPRGIFFCQHKYTLKIILEVAGLSEAYPTTSTPIEPNHQLANTVGPPFSLLDRYIVLSTS